MSCDGLHAVLKRSKTTGVDRLVMLALGDTTMREDGSGRCGVAHAMRWANASEADVQEALKRLSRCGEVAFFPADNEQNRIFFQLLIMDEPDGRRAAA